MPVSSVSSGSARHAIAGLCLGRQMRDQEILHHRTGGPFLPEASEIVLLFPSFERSPTNNFLIVSDMLWYHSSK